MLIDEMVQRGILQPLGAGGFEYAITHSFREYAVARIVEPLPRTRAKMLLDHIGDLARHFNRTATQNKYEIEVVVVFGSYMSLEPELPELPVGVIGRRRMPPLRHLDRRAGKPTEGHERIRELFEAQNRHVQVSFFRQLQDIPRPFSAIFKLDA